MKNTITMLGAAALVAASANATIVQIDINGSVDFGGVNNGQWQNASSGDPVTMSFQVDSNNFVDGSFPVRGYSLIQNSFSLTIDGNTGGLSMSDPFGTPYFVIRNDDPAVDGFFLGTSVDGFPNGVATDEAGGFGEFRALFSTTYESTRLDSLDILGAVGTYDFGGLSVFNWGLEDGPFQPMGFIFDQWTISVVPAPASLLAVAPFGLMAGRRRR